jgi:hypothetical protein
MPPLPTEPSGCLAGVDSNIRDAAKAWHDEDLERGMGYVPLPNTFRRKNASASTAWEWQFVFPARKQLLDRQRTQDAGAGRSA